MEKKEQTFPDLPQDLDKEINCFNVEPVFIVIQEQTYCYHGSGNPRPDLKFWVFDNPSLAKKADYDTTAILFDHADEDDRHITILYPLLKAGEMLEEKEELRRVDLEERDAIGQARDFFDHIDILGDSTLLKKRMGVNWNHMFMVKEEKSTNWRLSPTEVKGLPCFKVPINGSTGLIQGTPELEPLPEKPHHLWQPAPYAFQDLLGDDSASEIEV